MLIDSTAQYFILILPIFLILLGALCLLFWFKKKDFNSVFWLGLSASCHGIVIFVQSQFPLWQQYHVYWCFVLLYLMTFIFLSQAVILRFNLKLNWYYCLAVLLLSEAFVLYFSFYNNHYGARLMSYTFAVVAILGYYSYLLKFAANLSKIHQVLKWVFFTCTLVFIVRAILLSQYLLHQQTAILNFASTTHWFLNQFFILTLTMLFVALIVAAHFYEEYLQQQAQILQAKKQERVHLSQDLHDTLGSSLVRSIGQIGEQSQQIHSEQVLSMLKLLRDDLRQVIDYNTHDQDCAVPENPVVWAAPIRHRFSQVFESLNIDCIWQLDSAWLTAPSGLVCLNLRRIAEEALTNIIKHSQATQVSFHLQQYDAQLILIIQDNGIGFDLDKTLEGHVNIGLSSMQQRAKTIQAHLSIQSMPAHTCIRVTLAN